MTLRFRLLNTALMSMLLSFLMTLWVTWLNLGFITDCIQHWLHAWLMAWPAAFICVMLLARPVLLISQKVLGVQK